jgi:hypothetical protein
LLVCSSFFLPAFVIEENRPLLDAAQDLDKKLAALVAHGAGD